MNRALSSRATKRHVDRRPSVCRNSKSRLKLFLPIFDSLEDRQLLSLVKWTGAGDATNWNDTHNWLGNTLPTSTDDAVIDSSSAGVSITSSGDVSVQSIISGKPLTISG